MYKRQVYGDAGYTGMPKRPEIESDPHLSAIDYRTNTKNRFHRKAKALALIGTPASRLRNRGYAARLSMSSWSSNGFSVTIKFDTEV